MKQTYSPVILVIEDNRDIAEMLSAYLERRGYTIDYAGDGITGLHLAVTNFYDVIVLDLMLPGMDGIDVCKRLRVDAKNNTPLLMLTARDSLNEKVSGIEAGADDYLIKPFEIEELEVRLRALIRRNRDQISPGIFKVGDLSLDTGTLRIERAGKRLNLTPIGLKILTVLMRASPRVVNRQDIEREVWGDVLPGSDTLRSHLYNLRKVIDRPFDKPLLQTLQSAGYQIAEADAP